MYKLGFDNRKLVIVKKGIKYVVFLFLLMCVLIHTGFAQPQRRDPSFSRDKNFILLEMLDSLYDIQRYTLKTIELYGVDETIEIYNVDAGRLVLISVLPDFKSESNWTEIFIDDIRDQILDEREFYRIWESPKFDSRVSNTKSMDFKLVKWENDRFWVSNICLVELFSRNDYIADDYPSIFNVRQGILNTQQNTISIKQMMEIYGKSPGLMQEWGFPLDFREGGITILPNKLDFEREYLSRAFEINDNPAFQFWILTDWGSLSGYNYHRGIDRLVYMPGLGIVGGSYDFYFLYEDEEGWNLPRIRRDQRPRNNKTKKELWMNVIKEKVMLAEEIKQ